MSLVKIGNGVAIAVLAAFLMWSGSNLLKIAVLEANVEALEKTVADIKNTSRQLEEDGRAHKKSLSLIGAKINLLERELELPPSDLSTILPMDYKPPSKPLLPENWNKEKSPVITPD